MKLIPSLFLYTSLLFIFSCSGEQTDQKNIITSDQIDQQSFEIPAVGSVDGDTINMSGKFVLFYGPESDENNPEAFQTYRDLTSSIIDTLIQDPTIYSQYTSVNHIRVFSLNNSGSMVIIRSSFAEPVGVILSDGLQPPKIRKGYLKKDEINDLISEYFIQPYN